MSRKNYKYSRAVQTSSQEIKVEEVRSYRLNKVKAIKTKLKKTESDYSPATETGEGVRIQMCEVFKQESDIFFTFTTRKYTDSRIPAIDELGLLIET